MILEKNKEIQYMNRRSIVLEISAFKFFGRGCSKIVCPNTCFWEQTFWVQPLPLEFLAEISLQSSLSYIEFRLFSTKLLFYTLYLLEVKYSV